MPRYRKKPVVVDAIKYVGGGNVEGHAPPDWLWEALKNGVCKNVDGSMVIVTIEGEMTVRPGAWIIRGVKGELYPCDPEIFEASYEPATE